MPASILALMAAALLRLLTVAIAPGSAAAVFTPACANVNAPTIANGVFTLSQSPFPFLVVPFPLLGLFVPLPFCRFLPFAIAGVVEKNGSTQVHVFDRSFEALPVVAERIGWWVLIFGKYMPWRVYQSVRASSYLKVESKVRVFVRRIFAQSSQRCSPKQRSQSNLCSLAYSSSSLDFFAFNALSFASFPSFCAFALLSFA